MLTTHSHFVGLLVLVVAVISVRLENSDGRTKVIGADQDEEDVYEEADLSLQPRDKRTIGTLLSGVADLFGYDVQRRPSLLEQSALVYPVSGQIVAAPASAPAVLLDPNADINAILARQAAPPAPAAPPAAAPAPAPAAPAAPATPPVTLTDGVRRAFQVGVNWSNQRQQLGGAAPAAPAPAPAPAPAAPPPVQGERRAYTVGLNWQNLRQQLGGPAPAAPAPAGAAPAPAPAGPPAPQGFRQSYQLGFDFSNQRQQLGGPPPAARAAPPPAAPAAPPAPAAAAARLITPESIPDFIRHKPLSPTLVERIYFDKQHPLALKKLFYPKEINSCEENETGDDPPNRGKAAPQLRLPVRLDTPPREAEELEEKENKEEEEEEDEEAPQQNNQQKEPQANDQEEEEDDEEKEDEKQENNKENDKEEEAEEEEEEEVERRRKEAPRGFQKPAAQGWQKEETGDPNEKVFVLNQEYSYKNGPHKVKIDLPDYSDEENDQRRRHVEIKPTKPRKFKKFQSFSSGSSTPLAILKIRNILQDGPKDLKPFGTKTSSSFRLHRRSVRSVNTNSSTTSPPQDTIPPPTQKRVARDSDTAENIEVASITNKRLLDYFAKKFLNDAIVARQAIQNPHLIHEPYYDTRDHEKILEPFSISFKEEIGQRPKEATIISPIETIKHIRSKTNERVAEQHQNILKDIANNFEDRERYLKNQKSSPKKAGSSEDIKLYYAKALDGIVKNFENTANHERTRQEALNTQHEEIIEALKEIAKEKEQRRLQAENEEQDDDEENEPIPEKVKTESLKVVVGEPGGEKLTGDKAERIIEKLLEKEPYQNSKTKDKGAADYESTKNIPREKDHFEIDKSIGLDNDHYDNDKHNVDSGKDHYEIDKNVGREEHDYGSSKSIDKGNHDYDHHQNLGDKGLHYDNNDHHSEDIGDDKVKVGNEDIVGLHDEHLEDDDLEDISEIDESPIKESGTKEAEIQTEKEEDQEEPENTEDISEDQSNHADKEEIKQDKAEQKEESHPQVDKEISSKEPSDFGFFKPLDFIKDLEKVIYPEIESKEVHFPDINVKGLDFEHSEEKEKPFAGDEDKDIQFHESIHDEPETNAENEDEELEDEPKESDEQETKKEEQQDDKVELETLTPKETPKNIKEDFNPFKYSDVKKKIKNQESEEREEESKESDQQETNKKEHSENHEELEKLKNKEEPEITEEYFDPFKYSDFKKTKTHQESDEEETKEEHQKEQEELEKEAPKEESENNEEYFDPFKYSDFKKTKTPQEEKEESDKQETKTEHQKEQEELERPKEESEEYFNPFKYSDFKQAKNHKEVEESDELETKKKEHERNPEEPEKETPKDESENKKEYFNPFKYSDFKQPRKQEEDEESDEQETKKNEHNEDEKELERTEVDDKHADKYSEDKKADSSDKESSQPTHGNHKSKQDDDDEQSVEPQSGATGGTEKPEEDSDDAEEEDDEEEEEKGAAESKSSDEEAEKQREEEEKLKKQAENEKALREYINEHFEVDIINGQPVPKAVKDTERYKQIVENVRKPTESFDIFAPNDFNYKNIQGFANKNFNENLKNLEKAENKVEDTAGHKESEDADEEADDEPESGEDDFDEEEDDDVDESKAENTEDVPCRDPEFDRIEESIKQDLNRIPSSETEGTEKRRRKEQPKEEQSKQIPETLKYPHEKKVKDIYSDFHKKLINPEPQDSITHQVVHPNLHTGGFKHSGLEILENAEKVVTVPYDYDYSSSDKKVVLATTPATDSKVGRVKRKADWSYEPHSYQPGSYVPESYDPNPNFSYQMPQPQIETIPSIKKKDEPLGPRAVVFENESGRKKTYIRVKQKQQEMYG